MSPGNYWIAGVRGMPILNPRSPHDKVIYRPNNFIDLPSRRFQSFLLVRKISGVRFERGMQRLHACRERDVLYPSNDFVEAGWMLEDESDETTWYRAQVTDIDDSPAANWKDKVEVLATATLEYEETTAYGGHIHQVEFVFGRLLRRAELDRDDNNNPILAWRTPVIPNAHDGIDELDGDWKGEDIAEKVRGKEILTRTGLENWRISFIGSGKAMQKYLAKYIC